MIVFPETSDVFFFITSFFQSLAALTVRVCDSNKETLLHRYCAFLGQYVLFANLLYYVALRRFIILSFRHMFIHKFVLFREDNWFVGYPTWRPAWARAYRVYPFGFQQLRKFFEL